MRNLALVAHTPKPLALCVALKAHNFTKDGWFTMNGYPPIQVKGKWHVSERDKARLRIVLTDQAMRASAHDKPSKWNDRQDWAELQGDNMTWQNNKYARVKGK